MTTGSRDAWLSKVLELTRSGLSMRAANCCINANLMTHAQIEAAIKDGRLHPNNRFCRNYGWKTHEEIHNWIGLPEPERYKPRLKVCPHCGGTLEAAGGRTEKVGK